LTLANDDKLLIDIAARVIHRLGKLVHPIQPRCLRLSILLLNELDATDDEIQVFCPSSSDGASKQYIQSSMNDRLWFTYGGSHADCSYDLEAKFPCRAQSNEFLLEIIQ
jgi:hypothetical protein